MHWLIRIWTFEKSITMRKGCEIKILRILFDIIITKARTQFSSQFNGKTFDIATKEMQQNCKIKVSKNQMNRKNR